MLAELIAPRAKRGIDGPSFNVNSQDAAFWWSMLRGGTKSDSGVCVNRDEALTYAPLWRGVNLISRDVAKLPCLVYRRNGEGKDRDAKHPAYQLLRYKPNEYMTAFAFKQTLQGHALLSGNGYAYVFRSGGGVPLELLPLNPDLTYPLRVDGMLWYVTKIGVEQRKIPAADLFHVKGLGFDGLCGYDVVTYARNSLGRGIGAGKFASKYFANSARPSVVIEHPGKLSPEAAKRLRDSWESIHEGLEHSHRAAILEEGMKVNPFSHDAEKAQLLEMRQFEIRDVANWLGVPPHKLGDTTRTAFASLEQENQSYLDDALDPWLVAWEDECRDKLLSEKEKAADTHVIEFMRQALLRADMAARGEFYNKATGGHPWMTVNEVRGRENMNPKDGMDDIKPPTNNFGDAVPPAAPAKPIAKPMRDEASKRLLVQAYGRITHKAAILARKAAKKPDKFDEFLDEVQTEFQTWARDAIGLTLEVCGRKPIGVTTWCDSLHRALDNAYSTNTAATFESAVESVAKQMELELPALAADWE